MKNNTTVILKGSEVASLLPLDACILAVENAFRLYSAGMVAPPSIMGIHVENGGYHIKAGVMGTEKSYFVAKTNANFPKNPKKYNLPTIQGVVTVYDTDNGRLLALMDSIEVTIIRTGAATAVAAKYLAKKNARVATIVGCGSQGKISIKMLMEVRPIEKVFIYDIDLHAANKLIEELGYLHISIVRTDDLKAALAESDICVTCTTSKTPLLYHDDIRPGTFIAAVGSDNEDKQELSAKVLSLNTLITDVTNQCAKIGELHHAIEAKLMTEKDTYAELGEIILGKKKGRKSDSEIIIFDSTGMGLQDVAAASIVYEKAVANSIGLKVEFGN
ncbi:MAG TPA: ornithine cyclodeaminase family protein [Eudoraea sp.]|nr:ornithine cyclodeaminase family protein [Eudoraea sp.]